jgi:hypothetical protein
VFLFSYYLIWGRGVEGSWGHALQQALISKHALLKLEVGTSAKSAMTSSKRLLKRMLRGWWSNPSRGMMTESAVMSNRTCSMENTMTLSRTRILPDSLVNRLGSSSRMSRIGTPSLNFCEQPVTVVSEFASQRCGEATWVLSGSDIFLQNHRPLAKFSLGEMSALIHCSSRCIGESCCCKVLLGLPSSFCSGVWHYF